MGPAAPPPPGPLPPPPGPLPPPPDASPDAYPPEGYPYGAVQPKTPGVVITGFVLALVGIAIAPIPLGITAIVLGIVGLNKINASGGALKGRGLAIAALVIGPLDVIIGILYVSTRDDSTALAAVIAAISEGLART